VLRKHCGRVVGCHHLVRRYASRFCHCIACVFRVASRAAAANLAYYRPGYAAAPARLRTPALPAAWLLALTSPRYFITLTSSIMGGRDIIYQS